MEDALVVKSLSFQVKLEARLPPPETRQAILTGVQMTQRGPTMFDFDNGSWSRVGPRWVIWNPVSIAYLGFGA